MTARNSSPLVLFASILEPIVVNGRIKSRPEPALTSQEMP